MLRAAAGERTAARGDWIDALDDDGRPAALAVVVAILMAAAAVVLAVIVLHGAVSDVSTGFMTSEAPPAPLPSAAR